MSIPEDKKHDLISTGIGFIRSVTLAYGSEQGMELWETISNTLDPELKGQIFFAMLVGDHGDHVTLRGWNGKNPNGSVNGIINAIKTLRDVSMDLGLKEAKDITENCRAGNTANISCTTTKRHAVIADLRAAGFII